MHDRSETGLFASFGGVQGSVPKFLPSSFFELSQVVRHIFFSNADNVGIC